MTSRVKVRIQRGNAPIIAGWSHAGTSGTARQDASLQRNSQRDSRGRSLVRIKNRPHRQLRENPQPEPGISAAQRYLAALWRERPLRSGPIEPRDFGSQLAPIRDPVRLEESGAPTRTDINRNGRVSRLSSGGNCAEPLAARPGKLSPSRPPDWNQAHASRRGRKRPAPQAPDSFAYAPNEWG